MKHQHRIDILQLIRNGLKIQKYYKWPTKATKQPLDLYFVNLEPTDNRYLQNKKSWK